MSEQRVTGQVDHFRSLVTVMTRLRDPGGCPWDREQDHRSLIRYLIEEAYEVVDAIEQGDDEALADELGDLLLQVVFHAEIARSEERFDIDRVCRGIVDKLVRRHPHVFGQESAETAADVENRWEKIKAEEKSAKGDRSGVLDGVPRHLPALAKAQRLTEKAGKVGFDWPDVGGVLAKMREELTELEEAVSSDDTEAARAEFGDLLFVMANMARHLDIDAETALQGTNAKFVRRFRGVEAKLAEQGQSPVDQPLEELDRLWNQVKAEEEEPPSP
ncbi:MAG: nucleoside triphosphate pyrophosphohydrolase [Acidobacteriota bacterium]